MDEKKQIPIIFIPEGKFFDGDKGEYVDGSFYRKDLTPGSAKYLSNSAEPPKPHSALMYACPCGCGNISSITIAIGPKDRKGVWQWDGNIEKPTLQPSIQKLTPCCWHGYLTGGMWVEC